MVDINSEIVSLVADRMDASCLLLQDYTDRFFAQWGVFRGSFDDITKADIERAMVAADNDIKKVIKNQEASGLMRAYVKALRGGN